MSVVDKMALLALCCEKKWDAVLRVLDATASKEEAAELLFDVDDNVVIMVLLWISFRELSSWQGLTRRCATLRQQFRVHAGCIRAEMKSL